MAVIKSYGVIESGRLEIYNRQRLIADIARRKDCEVEIIIKKRGKRSLPSLGYYFGCVLVEIEDEFNRRGYEHDRITIHQYLKGLFYCDKVLIEETGEILQLPKSLADANQDEMSDYLDAVIRWCSTTLELSITPPNTQKALFTETF